MNVIHVPAPRANPLGLAIEDVGYAFADRFKEKRRRKEQLDDDAKRRKEKESDATRHENFLKQENATGRKFDAEQRKLDRQQEETLFNERYQQQKLLHAQDAADELAMSERQFQQDQQMMGGKAFLEGIIQAGYQTVDPKNLPEFIMKGVQAYKSMNPSDSRNVTEIVNTDIPPLIGKRPIGTLGVNSIIDNQKKAADSIKKNIIHNEANKRQTPEQLSKQLGSLMTGNPLVKPTKMNEYDSKKLDYLYQQNTAVQKELTEYGDSLSPQERVTLENQRDAIIRVLGKMDNKYAGESAPGGSANPLAQSGTDARSRLAAAISTVNPAEQAELQKILDSGNEQLIKEALRILEQ